MYAAIYGNIYLKNHPNVGKYTSTMEYMGIYIYIIPRVKMFTSSLHFLKKLSVGFKGASHAGELLGIPPWLVVFENSVS